MSGVRAGLGGKKGLNQYLSICHFLRKIDKMLILCPETKKIHYQYKMYVYFDRTIM